MFRFSRLLLSSLLGTATASAQPDIIDALMEKLRDKDAARRAFAARGLGGNGAVAKAAVPVLARLVQRDVDVEVRFSAARALGRIGFASPDVLAALRNALADAKPEVRCAAAISLARMGRLPPDAGPQVALTFTGKFPGETGAILRREMYVAAEQLGPKGSPLVAGLRVALREKDVLIRQGVAELLEDIGPGAEEAALELRVLLRDDDIVVRAAATFALLKIDPKDGEAGKLVAGRPDLPVPWSRIPLTIDQHVAIRKILAMRDEQTNPLFEQLAKWNGARREHFESAMRYMEAKDRASRGLDPYPHRGGFFDLRPNAKEFLAFDKFIQSIGFGGGSAPPPRPPNQQPISPQEMAVRREVGTAYLQASQQIMRLLTVRQKRKL